MKPKRPRVILFGAFDRHNLGDLLFPHVAAAMLGEAGVAFAGLVERDLRAFGGHRVVALPRLAAEWGDAPASLVHAGGEILTCDTWQAAVMALDPAQAQAAVARRDADISGRLAWAQRLLDAPRQAAYVVPKGLFRRPGVFIYNGVGGVDLGQREPAFRAEVLENLRAADWVGVRDRTTLEQLAGAGIAACLMPDPGVMVAELFGERIGRHGAAGEPAAVRAAFPGGYAAVQLGADFGDDATLATMAGELDRMAAETGLGVAFFRAGAAPWHDDPEVLRALAARMKAKTVRVFESLDIWDICALIAGSRVCCGSSLHGRIVALAFGRPRVNLLHPAPAAGAVTKQAAFAATWEAEGMPAVVRVEELADGVMRALAADREASRQTAGRLAAAYRQRFEEWSALLAAAGE